MSHSLAKLSLKSLYNLGETRAAAGAHNYQQERDNISAISKPKNSTAGSGTSETAKLAPAGPGES